MSANQTTQDSGTRYFHTDGTEVFGPIEPQALIELEISGRINRNTMVCVEGTETWVKLSESPLADSLPKRPQPPPRVPSGTASSMSTEEASAQAKAKIQSAVNMTKKAASDISDLRMQLLLPLFELRSLAWLQNKSALGMIVVGLTPLVLMYVIGANQVASYYGIIVSSALNWWEGLTKESSSNLFPRIRNAKSASLPFRMNSPASVRRGLN